MPAFPEEEWFEVMPTTVPERVAPSYEPGRTVDYLPELPYQFGSHGREN